MLAQGKKTVPCHDVATWPQNEDRWPIGRSAPDASLI